MLASMFMSGRRTLLVAAICCGLLLFASSCLATVPEGETVGGAKYRKEVLGFTEQQEEEYSQDFAEKSVQLHLPYNFKLIKVSFTSLFSQPFGFSYSKSRRVTNK